MKKFAAITNLRHVRLRSWMAVVLGASAAGLSADAAAQAQRGQAVATVLDLGTVTGSGELLVEHPTTGTVLDDGTLVVADLAAGVVRYLSPAGRVIRSVGRRGSGPGEFMHIWWIGRCGRGETSIWDTMLRRMTVLSPSGIVQRSEPLGPRGSDTTDAPVLLACNEAGVFALQGGPRAAPGTAGSPGVLRGTAPLSVGPWSGQRTRIDSMPAGELVVFGGGAGPRPLGAKTSVAVHGEKVYVSEGSTPVLRIYSTTGKELKHLQLPLTPVRADTASFSRAVDDLVEQIHGPNRDRVRERLLRTPMPENLPVMQSMTADGNGGLWIVSPSSGGQGSRIVVLDADGAIVAEKQMAVSVVALGGGAGRFLATYMDSRGTPRLVVLRVEAAR